MNTVVCNSMILTDAELADRFGIEVSARSVEMCGISDREACYIQTYPRLNGPDLELNRHLWQKLQGKSAWRESIRERRKLTIDVQRVETLPPMPDNWRIAGKTAGQLRGVYSFAAWTLQWVPNGPALILQAGSMAGEEPWLMKCLDWSRRIIVVDLLFECARRIRESGLQVATSSLFCLPFPDESFDCVYNNNVMEHLYNDVNAAVAEIFRVIRPGGLFTFAVPIEANASNPDLEFQTLNLGRSQNWWLIDPSHPWKTDLYDIHYRLSRAGFQEVRFAFRMDDLVAASRRKEHRLRRGQISQWVEKAYLALEESLMLQELEVRVRKVFNCYRFMGYRQRIHRWLNLPNRQNETLQVLVAARRP